MLLAVGVSQLWDLAAGKMLTEFRGHTGPITDIEFHPNEFLLATGSQDRSVKFWDLENFQLVCSTDGDSTPVRSIYFHGDGEVLFSGAQDVLKVYGWEPSRCFDNLALGWGKVADMTTSQNQLIAGAYSLTTVSVYVVDLKRVQPFGTPTTPSFPQPASFTPRLVSSFLTPYTHGQHLRISNPLRKSFCKTKPVEVPKNGKDNNVILPKVSSLPDSTTGDSEPEDHGTFITEKKDYNDIFHPNREYVLTHPVEPEKPPVVHVGSNNKISTAAQTRATPVVVSRPSPMVSRPATLNVNGPFSPSSDPPKVVADPPAPNKLPVAPRRKENMVSVVRPEPQRAIVLPEQKPVEFVPDQRERPAELDLQEFLPKHLLRPGGGSQPVVSEAEALSTIGAGHRSMATVLAHRLKNLQIILAQWSVKDVRIALESAIHMADMSILVDILNAISLRPQLWNLDMCQILLPTIYDLLQSKYEAYMSVGCAALKLILKNFCQTIKTNITAPPGIGVDVTREERYNKCMSCYNHLLSVRAFLLKRQTLQGKLGQSFRELHILMQGLE
ncbi:KATNB1 [Cordylochernes scorpioides]|uniref:KATNB1 n=1 Tax=Cordylochernes scorpioides TaxID=51811 RepID=A0ABY6LJ22_9ARAC|nr:KATNB1 [Cordylochernes scorpioides]